MTPSWLQDLLGSAGSDGCSGPPGGGATSIDLDALIKAWSIERGHGIESEFLLSLSKATITQLLAAERSAPRADDRDIWDLVRQIEVHLRRSDQGQV